MKTIVITLFLFLSFSLYSQSSNYAIELSQRYLNKSEDTLFILNQKINNCNNFIKSSKILFYGGLTVSVGTLASMKIYTNNNTIIDDNVLKHRYTIAAVSGIISTIGWVLWMEGLTYKSDLSITLINYHNDGGLYIKIR